MIVTVRLTRALTPLCVFLAAALLPAAESQSAEPSGKTAAADGGTSSGQSTADPEFGKAASKNDFEKGKALFADGKYKEAEQLFRKVKGDGKEKQDQELVETWIQGTAGAFLLEKLKRMEVQGKLKTYDQVQASFPKYKGTPAAELFRQHLKDMEARIFEGLESFDTASASYSEKFGKTFISDPALLLDGTQCLRWANTKERKAAALKVESVPTDWSGYDAVELWVNWSVAPRGIEAVIMPGEKEPEQKKGPAQKKVKKTTSSPRDCFQKPFSLPGQARQWSKVRLPISEFQKSGNPLITRVAYFQLQIPGGAQFDFLIDKIALIRKEGEAGGQGATPAKPAPKSGGKK